MQLSPYLRRIGYAGTLNPTRETLAAVVASHATAIPFENIDAFLGRPVSLDPIAVFDKLVTRQRGGWCFEQNLLLGEALRELGFDVTDLAARVVWGRAADAVAPRTHRALLVRVAGQAWLADVGFGGMTMAGQLVHDPASQFTRGLVASRIVDTGRHVLRGRELAFHTFEGNTTRRELRAAAELVATLRGELGIVIDGETESALLVRLESQTRS